MQPNPPAPNAMAIAASDDACQLPSAAASSILPEIIFVTSLGHPVVS